MKRAICIVVVGLAASLGVAAPASAEGERGPSRSGLPGLHHTITAPVAGSAPLRLGIQWEQLSIDPSHGIGLSNDPFGPATFAKQLRFVVGMHASRYLYLSGGVPYRWLDRVGVNVGTAEDPDIVGAADVTGLGDIDLALTGQIYRNDRVTLGAWGLARVPTGDEAKGLGTGHVDGEFGLHMSSEFFRNASAPSMWIHLNLGVRVNKNEADGYGVLDPDATVSPVTTGVFAPIYPAAPPGQETDNDEVLLRMAVEFQRRWTRFYLEGAVDWLSRFDDGTFQENAMWLTPGLDLGPVHGPRLKAAWAINLGADKADTPYVPTLPDWVFAAAVSMPIYLGGRDSDGDFIADSEDACPDTPEDPDGYQDEDGCPEDDNDGDGIKDRHDLAPNLPEDIDGFEDHDGRPELDNDLDGIADTDDRCPRQPEDFDGFQDEDGCPDIVVDSDGDGVEDRQDVCPNTPEDPDGFEDGDGCPDRDNDLDGIDDEDDECPMEPETYDGVDDDDGCPDTA